MARRYGSLCVLQALAWLALQHLQASGCKAEPSCARRTAVPMLAHRFW